MPSFPVLGYKGQRFETAGVASSNGTAVTSSSSANTKGSYSQLIASTTYNAEGFLLQIGFSQTSQDLLIDIAIGGAGSEVVIVPNIPHNGSGGRTESIFIPIFIPRGSRLSARAQSTGSSAVANVELTLMAKGFLGQSGQHLKATNYGANTSTTGGVSVDPGGTINTKGSYSEITSSTTAPIRWLFVGVLNQHNTVPSFYTWTMDVAIGASSSEKIIVPDLFFSCMANDDAITPTWFPVNVNIPLGTRIAVRAQCSGNDVTDRKFDAIVIGV